MIDNKELIKNILTFANKGDSYHVQIIARKKDNPDNRKSVRVIKTYTIYDQLSLDNRFEDIVTLCETFKARAYIGVSPKNDWDVSFEMMEILTKRIRSGQISGMHGLYESAHGAIKSKTPRWVVDLDEPELLNEVRDFIPNLSPNKKVLLTVPTKSGYHLITERFDVLKFKEKFPNIDIQKNNPTLLYFPDSLD